MYLEKIKITKDLSIEESKDIGLILLNTPTKIYNLVDDDIKKMIKSIEDLFYRNELKNFHKIITPKIFLTEGDNVDPMIWLNTLNEKFPIQEDEASKLLENLKQYLEYGIF